MTYTTRMGQMWDEIAYAVYGDTVHTDVLMQANTDYAAVFLFPAGVVLNVPALTIAQTHRTYTPPWQRRQEDD